MRTVVVYELLSLDGVAESPDAFFGWDDVLDENLSAVIGTQDTVVLGRRSYDEWSEFWPEATIEPFASFINTVPKLVATSTPLARDWSNSEVIDGDLVAAVQALRDGNGGDIGVHASVSVAQSLIAAGVVDELKLVIAPATVGTGRRLFDGPTGRSWELVRSVASPTGHLIADYRAAG